MVARRISTEIFWTIRPKKSDSLIGFSIVDLGEKNVVWLDMDLIFINFSLVKISKVGVTLVPQSPCVDMQIKKLRLHMKDQPKISKCS